MVGGLTARHVITKAARLAVLGGLATLLIACGGGGGSPMPPPAITTQPQSQTLLTGSTATFNVVATGTGTLTYQWNKNGAAIAGATSASYVTPAATLADSGASFTVVVSNSGGQVTSATAFLTANANPEGIYTGTMTNRLAGTTWAVFAIVLKDGTFTIFAKDHDFTAKVPVGIVLSGAKITPTGGTFTTNFSAYTQPGLTLTSGTGKVTGALEGTIVPGTSITGTYTSLPLDAGSFSVTAMADYGRAASGATIAGTYHYGYFANNFLVDATTTIDANGIATVSDTAMCQGPATSTVPDPTTTPMWRPTVRSARAHPRTRRHSWACRPSFLQAPAPHSTVASIFRPTRWSPRRTTAPTASC